MQHLSRRFSGYVFLYVVIASAATRLIWDLSVNFGLWFFFFTQHATLLRLFTSLIIFIPPLVSVSAKRYPMREALRIRAFTAAQFVYAIVIGICAYFALTTISTLFDKLSTALMYPDFANFTDGYFPSYTFSVWPYLFTACLIPAVLEGGVYQGAMLSGFHQTRPLKACLTVGLLYALVQFNLATFIPNALLGFTLCYITLRSGSVIPAVIASFTYLLAERLTTTAWLNSAVFTPIGLSQNTAAIILAVVFTLLGGLLLVKMPDRKYEKGAFRRALRSLRRAFPGLFSLSALDADIALEEEPSAETPVETAPEAQQLVFETVLAEATVPERHNLRDDNPLIVGIFISGIITLIRFGIVLLGALGYFGG